MAIIDAQHVFSQSQSLIATAPDTLESTNVYDLSAGASSPIAGAAQSRNLGVGETLYFHFLVMTGLVQASTNGTLDVQIVTSAAAALTTPTVHWYQRFTDGAGTFGDDLTTVGAQFTVPLSPDKTWLRYLGVIYVVTTQDTSAGAITVWMDRQAGVNTLYASGLNFA